MPFLILEGNLGGLYLRLDRRRESFNLHRLASEWMPG
jgi:hypothetical protein